MNTDLSQYLSAGYFLTKRVTRPTYASEALLPSNILSVSQCICSFIPDTWCFTWTGDDKEFRNAKAQAFHLTSDVLKSMTSWITKRLEKEIGWPNVCYSIETTRTLAKEFLSHDPDILIIGLGLHQQYRDEFCCVAEPPDQRDDTAPIGKQGIHTSILKAQALESGGKPLGFEPLVFNQSLSDSWLCNGLEVIIENQLGIIPNPMGLIDDFEGAAKCVELISSEKVSAEPGLWLPWLLVEYPPLS